MMAAVVDHVWGWCEVADADLPTSMLDRLVDPAVAYAPHPPDPVAVYTFAEREWTTLAGVYQRAAEQAWRARRYADALRLLLAESGTALRMADRRRFREAVSFLAERHRLCGGFTAAERWNHLLLREPRDASTALIHAQVWREMAALREVAGRYADGVECCRRAVAICASYSDVAGMAARHVKVLLQRAVLERQQGDLAAALRTLGQARDLAADRDLDPFTRGLVALREGGLEITLGRPDVALDAFRRAGRAFDGVSDNNLLLTRLREVACLRAMARSEEALAVTDELVTRFRAAGGSAYRLGQVMLERAEVLEEVGDHDGVAAVLEEIRPYYAESETLEAVRWHRHVARHLIHAGGDEVIAARHLANALDVVTRPDRADLTRTMLALHDLARLRRVDVLPSLLWSAVWRAALLAADLQRTPLPEPVTRWSMHAQREEVYGAAVLISTEATEPIEAARIAETGRADVLNHVLATSSDQRSATIAAQQIDLPGPDPALVDRIFAVGRLASETIRSGRMPELPPSVPLPGELPPPSDLDAMADVVVVITVGESPDGWWSSVLTRTRGGAWQAASRTATPKLVPLVSRLATGEHLPPRGVTRDLWERLGEFLLPDPQIWAGTREAPQSVAIAPDPRLWHLPHAALLRQGAHLHDVAEVTLTPSLRTLQLLLHRASAAGSARTVPRSGRSLLSHLDTTLPGFAVEKTALDAWPAGHDELTDLAAVHPGGALLYVSGHGSEAGATPQFGPATISLDTLAASALPRLVVLNGCWSGTAVSRFGQDPLSLAVGALLGGADTVVAGIGRVGSVASAHVGAAFVTLVQDGLPAAAALRLAQRGLRDAHPDLGPFDWAGLCAVGLGR